MALLVARDLRGKRAVEGDPGSSCRAYRFAASKPNTYTRWPLDFHGGSRKVLTSAGQWETPAVLGVLDDRSRLACHVQWYQVENAENLVHGLSQAFQKRGLPRSLMTDNGGAMIAGETQQGLGRLSILHRPTLSYSPYQNGKQEVFWGQLEGPLLAMLEGVEDPTLDRLNEATQAWVEMEYQRRVHSETRQTPLERCLAGPAVGRPAPDSEALRLAFTVEETRTQRRSDGTLSINAHGSKSLPAIAPSYGRRCASPHGI